MDNYGYGGQNDYYFGNWNDFTLDDEKRAKSRFSRLFLALFVFTIVTNAVAIIAQVIVELIFGAEKALQIYDSVWFIWALNVLAMYVIAFPLYYLMVRGMRQVERIKSDMKISDFVKLFFISQAFTYAGNLIGNVFNGISTAIFGQPPENAVSDMVLSSPLWIVLLVSVILAPIVEELMFRKLLIDRMSIYGDKVAIVTSAIAFGLFHGNFYQLFYATFIGFILGYIYVKTANIIYPMLMHILFNLWGSLVPWLLADKYDRYYELAEIMATGDVSSIDPEEYLSVLLPVGIYSAVQVAFIIAGIVFLVKRMKQTFISDRCEVLIPKQRRAAVIVGNVGAILFLISTAFTMLANMISPLLNTAA